MEKVFGSYIVKREAKRFFAIYKDYTKPDFFVTHRTNWNNACRVAKLLNETYHQGREDYRDDTWLSRY